MPEYLTCVDCGLPAGDPKCPACPTCGAHDCTEDDQTDLSACPYYNGTGICSFDCREEPHCRTDEPLNGWPSMRKAVPDA
jgi:hypothetical protein